MNFKDYGFTSIAEYYDALEANPNKLKSKHISDMMLSASTLEEKELLASRTAPVQVEIREPQEPYPRCGVPHCVVRVDNECVLGNTEEEPLWHTNKDEIIRLVKNWYGETVQITFV